MDAMNVSQDEQMLRVRNQWTRCTTSFAWIYRDLNCTCNKTKKKRHIKPET
ncbi:hypothetical protein Hanom_Chr03g00256481 [Helianthus anomalus]